MTAGDNGIQITSENIENFFFQKAGKMEEMEAFVNA